MTCLCTCPDSLKSKSELFNKRNQPIEASCKTCGGSFLVDGIRSIFGNMLSTVNMEVAKSINPELSWWKAVKKGRRSKNTIARRLNEGMNVINRSPKRVGDFSCSDSDKIAEASCWSSDKVECVLIKKRRQLLHTSLAQSHNLSVDCEDSVSPQSLGTPMPSEDTEQISVYTHSSDPRGPGLSFERKAARKFGLSDRMLDAKISKVATGKLYNSVDFSGIALLADVACINDMDDDLDNAKEAHAMVASTAPGGSGGSTPHPKEILALKDLTDPGRGDMMHESNTEASIFNEFVVAPEGFAEFKEHSVVNRAVSPKVDRMHWDLNTLMDTWEQPLKESSMGNAFAKGSSDGAQKEKPKVEICDKKGDFEYCKHFSGKFVPPAQDGAISEFSEVCKLESVLVNDRNTFSHSTKALDSLSAQRETFGELVTRDASLADSSFVKSHNASCMLVSNGSITNASDSPILTQIRDSSVKAAGLNKAAISEVPFPAKPSCGGASTFIACSDDPIMTSEVSDTSNLNAIGVESCDSNPTERDFCNQSSKCEDLSIAKASIVEGRSVTVEPMEQHDNIDSQLKGNEVISKFSDSYRFDQVEKGTFSVKHSSRNCNEGLQIDDPSQFTRSASGFEDSHNSDISHEDHSQMVRREHVTRIEVGYDSPFEDGELRGSIIYSLEDNEIEDSEDECVDYESDGRDDMDFDACDYPASEIVEAGSDGSQSIQKRILSTSKSPEVDFVKGGSPRNFMRRQFNRDDYSIGDSDVKKGLGTGSGSATQRFSDKIGGKDYAFRKGHTSDCMEAYEFRGSCMEEIGSKTNRGKLQSSIEGPQYLDATDGNSAARKYQNRPHNLIGDYHKPVREVCPDKFVGRYRSGYYSQDGGATGGQWNRWNSRNFYPNAYDGPESHNYSKRCNFADKFGRLNYRDHKQSIIFPSEGVRRPPVRRRSSVERDVYDDIHRRMVPVRGGYRSRSDAESFSQRVARGTREEGYVGDLSSVRVPLYLPRGERTGSPASGRVARISLPRKRCRSRSRTPSPHQWHTQRERNFSSRRRHSRSPDLRCDARMKQMRMPFRKHGFTANYGEDFSSSTRGQLCPSERSCSRWIDERSFICENSKNRWS